MVVDAGRGSWTGQATENHIGVQTGQHLVIGRVTPGRGERGVVKQGHLEGAERRKRRQAGVAVANLATPLTALDDIG